MKEKIYQTCGKRKSAIVRIVMKPGSGDITINKESLESYFPYFAQQNTILTPFHITKTIRQFDIYANIQGGGKSGQAEAMRLAIAKALQKFNPEFRPELKSNGLLKRDERKKERKKYGQPGARKRFQFSKR